MTATLSGNMLNYNQQEDTPALKWKSNGAPVEPGATAMIKGAKWSGSLERKN